MVMALMLLREISMMTLTSLTWGDDDLDLTDKCQEHNDNVMMIRRCRICWLSDLSEAGA